MLKFIAIFGIIFCAWASIAHAQAAQPAVSSWKLVWSDDFSGTTLDRSKWTFDLGNGFYAPDAQSWVYGWGNNELENYTDRPDNVYVKDGLLHIRVLKEDYQGSQYTSARVVTRGLFSKAYGRFEFRAKLPVGKGMWPALWLLPADNAYGGWAASGEIDVLEARGQQPGRILGSLNYGSHWPGNDVTEADEILPDGGTIGDFHTYALEWEPGVMRWYVDDHLYSVKRHWWSSSRVDAKHEGDRHPAAADLNPWPAPYDKPFYLIMNVAVGGNFLGSPNAKTVFPQEMQVDYVRVYDKIGGYGPVEQPGQDEGIEKTVADTTAPAGKDVALNKPATASSEEKGHPASAANDGDDTTRWCASSADVAQWWQVDLQQPADLTGIEIKWEMDGKNYQYVVEGSTDAKTWQTLSDEGDTTSASQTQDLQFKAAGIRYVRIRMVGLDDGSWASIINVKVCGS